MTPFCDQCGGPIDLLRPGRVARFCSDRCRVGFHRAVVPEIMRKERRWVTYDWPSKVPLQLDGRPASVTDPDTWASYPQVRGRQYKGYVLGNNVGCVDFDHCFDAAGALHLVVADIIGPLMGKTYIEKSPSGDGLHMFGVINEDVGWNRRMPDGLGVELYSRERYITVTGQRVSKTSRLHPIRQHLHHLAPVLG